MNSVITTKADDVTEWPSVYYNYFSSGKLRQTSIPYSYDNNDGLSYHTETSNYDSHGNLISFLHP